MNNYNFGAINDKDFEVLTADVISALEGVRVERFKPGRDAGVDGRFFVQGAKRLFSASTG
ncbi:MAG: hypothetical protein P4L83_08340 [Nevskia sp.]|nr:hypothetical protein [Nevskia sp.]